MLKYHLRIAIRTLKRNRFHTLINIAGLTIGITCFLFICLYVHWELSYDTFNKKADRIFRVATEANMHGNEMKSIITPSPLAATLINNYPEIENVTRLMKDEHRVGDQFVTYKEHTFKNNVIMAADANFFDVFTLPLIKGDYQTALKMPNSVIITESASKKCFGTNDPINKSIKIGGKDFAVTGILKDIPSNSHFNFDFLVSLESFESSKNGRWNQNIFATYIVLKEGFNAKNLQEKLPALVSKYLFNGNNPPSKYEFILQPLLAIHLKSNMYGEFQPNGNAVYVYVFIAIAIFVLLIACVNFINLSTARSVKRAKEIGVSKVLGSKKIQLMRQFFIESGLISFAALFFSLILVESFLPLFSSLIDGDLKIQYFNNFYTLPFLIALAIIVSILSGSYPALYMSSFKPGVILKGHNNGKTKGAGLRMALVIFQFAISIILIISTIIVKRQMDFVQHKKLGFDKEHVVVIKNTEFLAGNISAFKETLLNYSDIENVTGSYTLLGRQGKNLIKWGIKPENNPETNIALCICDENFQNTFKMDMVEGRFFSKEFSTDELAIVINEETVKQFGWENPIGKKIELSGKALTVVGVIKDFHYNSLHEKVYKTALIPIFGLKKRADRFISVRIRTENLNQTLANIKKSWESFSPSVNLEYSFLNQDFNSFYKHDQQINKIASMFSFLTIFITLLGLFGLASFIVEQKNKEIGVRKVNGAKRFEILFMLNQSFLKSVIAAFLIACPIAYFMMSKWLENFAYKTEISWWIFVTAGFIALIIAFATVSWQSWRAANRNPVEALRYE